MVLKALLAVVIVLVIAALMITTETGRKYAEFLKEKVGDAVSLITKFWQPTGEGFTFTLTTDIGTFQGQNYKVANSSLSASGIYDYIKIGNQVINLKEGKKVKMFVDNMKGNFEITNAGSVKITGDSDYIEIGDITFSGQTRVEAELVPDEFSLTDLAQGKIVLSSVTGDIRRGEKDQASLYGNKVEINGFAGELKLSEDGSVTLSGSAVSIKTDKFTWI